MYLSPFRSICSTKILTENGRCSRFEYAVANCQGWRRTQEDKHLAITDLERNTSIFAVFDGHNGPEVARFVSEYLPKQLLKNRNYRNGNIERGIQESFMALDELLITKEANDLLLGYFRDRKSFSQQLGSDDELVANFVGCTAVVLLIKNDIYYCANIGDSRCLIGRAVGNNNNNIQAFQLSIDHKPLVPEERMRIEQAGGTVINGRINGGIDVSRAFGDHIFKQNNRLNRKQQMIVAWPYTRVEKISEEDRFIVLICDGIWNSISNQELVNFIMNKMNENQKSLTKICESIIEHILPKESLPKQGIAGKDNMTIMIIRKSSSNSNPAQQSMNQIQTSNESTTTVRHQNMNTTERTLSSTTTSNRRERSTSSSSSSSSSTSSSATINSSKIMFGQDIVKRI